jgi:hypothetical protein
MRCKSTLANHSKLLSFLTFLVHQVILLQFIELTENAKENNPCKEEHPMTDVMKEKKTTY